MTRSKSLLLAVLAAASLLVSAAPVFAQSYPTPKMPGDLPYDPSKIPPPKLPKDMPEPPKPDASCREFCDYTEDACKAMCKEKKVQGCEAGCARLNAQCTSKCEDTKKEQGQ